MGKKKQPAVEVKVFEDPEWDEYMTASHSALNKANPAPGEPGGMSMEWWEEGMKLMAKGEQEWREQEAARIAAEKAAFDAAVDDTVRRFDLWLAEQEAAKGQK